MDHISLELYKIFYMVAETGSISHAAEALYTGQPSVSKSVKRLETLLGTPLFFRSSKGVFLTQSGKQLYQHVKTALFELHEGELAVRKFTSATRGTLNLGISPTLYQYYISPHLKNFLTAHDSFTVNIIDHSMSYNIVDSVLSGKLDVGITSIPAQTENIEFIPLTKIQEYVVAAPDYLARFHALTPKEFFDQATFICLEKGNIARDYNERYLKDLGIELKPEISTSNMNFIVELVSSGIGFGIVYKAAALQQLREQSLTTVNIFPPIPSRKIGFVLKKDHLTSFATKTFMDYYQSIFSAE